MTARLLISIVAALLVTVTRAPSSDATELSWRRGGEWDVLLINNVDIVWTSESSVEDITARVKSAAPHLSLLPAIVRIPPGPDPHPPQSWLPNFSSVIATFFAGLTSPNREVTYFYGGRQLRRYRITCSSKGTAENPEQANYWLDGEFLGNWDKAKLYFATTKWEDDSVVDFLCDHENPLTASGVGLSILPDLESIFSKHHIIVNRHSNYRKLDDR